jgi:hypothetical protein
MENYWHIKGYCYWEKELSKDEDGNVWINIGWHCPMMVSQNETIQRVVAYSARWYLQTFN